MPHPVLPAARAFFSRFLLRDVARLSGAAVRCAVLTYLLSASPLAAQDHAWDAEEPSPLTPPLEWLQGPDTAPLGDVAEIDVSETYLFADGDGTRLLLEATGNLTNGSELGTITPVSELEGWFLVFEFDGIGFVKDDEKDLDGDAILKSLREGNKHSNEMRRKRGYPEMTIVGWEVPPHYNEETNNLEWCLRGESEGYPVLNHNIRLLGRRGVMSATLVVDPVDFAATLPRVSTLLEGYRFTDGNRYAQFVQGDRVAEIGLTALVAGGVGAMAAKAGLFKKFGKLIVVAAVAVFGAIARFFRSLTGREEPHSTPPA